MKSREERQFDCRTAEQALQHAKGLLKRCDALELMKLCARLSLHEAHTSLDHPLCAFPMVNAEKMRMLCHVVLASRAVPDRSGRLPSPEDFRKIVNDCNHALYDPTEMRPLKAASGTRHAHLEFQRFFVRMAAVQFPGQEPHVWERVGRLIAMLEELPQRYPDRVPEHQRKAVARVLPRVEEVLGASLSDLSRGFADLLLWQMLAHEANLAALGTLDLPRSRAGESDEERQKRQARIMLGFLSFEPLLDDRVVFTVGRILSILDAFRPGYSALARHRIEAFLRLSARSIDELRAMVPRDEFTVGHAGKRLSPLERFPIVRFYTTTGAEPLYVVPNYRHLAKSFGTAVDFALLEALGSDYEQARGALFHLYLRQLIEARLPQTIVIPETRYATASGGKDSPDLTLVDPQASRIVGVEVKGRQINLATRLAVGDAELAENLRDAFEQLRKLPAKVVDLRVARPEFRPWQQVIAATGSSPPILVAVLRQGIRLLSHLVREQASLDPAHPLSGLAEPYCLLSADSFERAIEIASRKGRPLSELLEEHYQRSGSHDYTAADADSFGEELLLSSASDTYAGSFAKHPEWWDEQNRR